MQTATAKKGKTQIPGQFFIWIFSFFRVSFSRVHAPMFKIIFFRN
jgi:hypothetical protein